MSSCKHCTLHMQPGTLHLHLKICKLTFNSGVSCPWLQETSCGQFAGECVATTARIMADAEGSLDHDGNYSHMRNFTPKPLPTIEVQ